jgi:hypothetical protein
MKGLIEKAFYTGLTTTLSAKRHTLLEIHNNFFLMILHLYILIVTISHF